MTEIPACVAHRDSPDRARSYQLPPFSASSEDVNTDGDALGDLDPEQMLWDAFRRARRRYRGAIVGISGRTVITNASAWDLLGPADRHVLRRWVQNAGAVPEGAEVTLALASGLMATARCHHIGPSDGRLGIVLHISVSTGPHLRLAAEPGDELPEDGADVGERALLSGALDPSLLSGWSDLTDSERAVADLVGRGLSNKQAGRTLFISRHTVDYHLRRVFKKLGIKSRVELARLIGEHYDLLSDATPKDAVA